MAKASVLAPGFRFHPTDVEAVMYYLKRKVMGKRLRVDVIPEVGIYKYPPWDLPDKSLLGSGDRKWYFFCPVEKKYSCGNRMKRATEVGFWKISGKDRPVCYNREVVGSIKTLIFHRGRAPKGDRTDWVMYEYRLEDNYLAQMGVVENTHVLCMLFQKEGKGPKNGAQYGAVFKEEDWDDDKEVDCEEAGLSAGLFSPIYAQPTDPSSSAAVDTLVSESCVSKATAGTAVCQASVGDILPEVLIDDEMEAILASFKEEHPRISMEDINNKDVNHDRNVEAASQFGGGNLGQTTGVSEGGFGLGDLEGPIFSPDYLFSLNDLL